MPTMSDNNLADNQQQPDEQELVSETNPSSTAQLPTVEEVNSLEEQPQIQPEAPIEVPEAHFEATENEVGLTGVQPELPDGINEQPPAPTLNIDVTNLAEPTLAHTDGPTQSSPLQLALTTPLKALPALKDIDKLTTPKLFMVARDEDTSIMQSSPLTKPARLDTLAEMPLGPAENDVVGTNDSDKDDIAKLIECSPSELELLSGALLASIKTALITNESLRAEVEVLQVNQEHIIQVQEKKTKSLQSDLNILQESHHALQQQHNQVIEEVLPQVRLQNCLLLDDNNALKQELARLKNNDELDALNYSKQVQERDHEIAQLYEQIDQLTRTNISTNTKLSEMTKEVNEVRNERFQCQLSLTKANNELLYLRTQKTWFETELKSLQSRYTELISKNETEYMLTSNQLAKITALKEALETTCNHQKERLLELSRNLESKVVEIDKCNTEVEELKRKFMADLESKQRMLELIEVQSKERGSRVEQLEKYIEDLKRQYISQVEQLTASDTEKNQTIELLQEKLKRTEETLDEELRKETELPKLSESAEKLASMLAGGMSLSALYTEFSHLKKQLVMERLQKENLTRQLQTFIEELETKKPAIANYREQIEFYQQALKDSFGKIENFRLEKLEVEKYASTLSSKVNGLETELASTKTLCKDLGRQLCFYLIHSKIRDSQDEPLTVVEKRAIENILSKSEAGGKDILEESDTDRLISDRLVGFASIVELQHKNQELLTVVRKLGKQLENKDAEFTKDIESIAIEEAKDAILTLQSELESVSVKLESAEHERDVYKRMAKQGRSSNGDVNVHTDVVIETTNDLKKQVAEYQNLLNKVRAQSEDKITELSNKLTESDAEKHKLILQAQTLKHDANIADTRFKNLEATLESVRIEMSRVEKDAEFWKQQTAKQEAAFVNTSNKLKTKEVALAQMQVDIRGLSTEREVWKSLEQSLSSEIDQLRQDKTKLSEFVVNLQLLLSEREESSKKFADQLNLSLENYQKLQAKLDEKEERIMILSSQNELSMKAQNTKLEQFHDLSSQLMEARAKLSEKTSEVNRLTRKLDELNNRGGANGFQNTDEPLVGDEKLAYELESLREELRIAEKQVAEFLSIARSAEAALVNSTNAFEQLQSDVANERLAFEQVKKSLTEEVSQLRQALSDSESANVTQRDQFVAQTEKLQLQSLEWKLKADAYDELRRDYETKLSSISQDLSAQLQLANDFQTKYQAELRKTDELNATIAQLKKDALTYGEQISDLKDEILQRQHELDLKVEAIEEVKQSTQEELSKVQVELEDLRNQNQILLNQLELRGASTEDASEESLREVVSYLRHGKDAAEAKLNIHLEEQQRLTLKLSQANIELEAARSELRRSAQSAVQLTDHSEEHQKLVDQLQQLNILRESNTTLRRENENHVARIEELTAEVKAASTRLEPLQQKLRDLETEVEVKDQTIKLVNEELSRCKLRLMDQSEQRAEGVDSTELQRLEAELAAVKSELERLQQEHAHVTALREQLQGGLTEAQAQYKDAQAKLTENETVIKSLNDKFNKLKSEAQDKLKRRSAEVKELRDTIESLKAKASDAPESEGAVKELETRFDEEKRKLVEEKTGLEKRLQKAEKDAAELKSSYETQLQQGTAQNDAAQASIKKEYELKQAELYASIKAELEKDNESKINARIALLEGADAIREEIKKQFEEESSKLKEEFARDLEAARQDTRKLSEKTTELRVKMLNKKISKLTEQLAATKKLAGSPGSLPVTPQVKLKPAGNQLQGNLNRPAINRANSPLQQTPQKRPFTGKNQTSSKKPKE